MSQTHLDSIAKEILALETETFEVSDYADVTEAVLAGSTSCTSRCPRRRNPGLG